MTGHQVRYSFVLLCSLTGWTKTLTSAGSHRRLPEALRQPVIADPSGPKRSSSGRRGRPLGHIMAASIGLVASRSRALRPT
jgi:hypothetical protein